MPSTFRGPVAPCSSSLRRRKRRNPRPVAGATAAALAWVTTAALAAPIDRYWREWRHNPTRTAHNPTPMGIAAPVVRWRAFLGGSPQASTAVDVNLDGDMDVVNLEGGRLTARSVHGKIFWKTAALGFTQINAVADTDGDSVPEVIASSSQTVAVVASGTGAVRWMPPAGAVANIQSVGVADFDGDGHADVAVGGQGPTLLLQRFAPTQAALAAISPATTWGHVGTQYVDVDGDGVPDVLRPLGAAGIAAYHAASGALLAETGPWSEHAPLRVSVRSLPAPDGGTPLLAYQADWYELNYPLTLRGMHLMRRAADKLAVVWSAKVKDPTSDRYLGQPGAVGDWDGDGTPEVLASWWESGAWRLEARDLMTGAVLHSADAAALGSDAGGPVLDAVLRVPGAPQLAAVVRWGASAYPDASGPLALIRWRRDTGFGAPVQLGAGQLIRAALVSDGAGVLESHSVAPGVAALWLARDTDGDAQADRVESLSWSETGVVPAAGKDFGRPTVFRVRMAGGGSAGAPSMLVSHPTGETPLLDGNWKVANDADGDGVPDLRYGGDLSPFVTVAPVQDGAAAPLVMASFGATLRVFDPALAGPLQPPALQWAFQGGNEVRAMLGDVNGDGVRELLVRDRPVGGTAELRALTASGAPLWTYTHDPEPWRWYVKYGDLFTVFDVDGDGADDIIAGLERLGGAKPGLTYFQRIRGTDGKAIWPAGGACTGPADAVMGADPYSSPPRIVLSELYRRHVCDAATGAGIAKVQGKEGSFGIPTLADVDQDGLRDVVLAGSWAAVMVERSPDLKTLWAVASKSHGHAAVTVVPMPGGLAPRIIHTETGTSRVIARDGATGKTVWQWTYQDGLALPADATAVKVAQASGLASVADLTGDGDPGALFRTSQGWLYAVSAIDGTIRWARDFGGAIGDPIVTDLDGDPESEVLLATWEGELVALDRDVLGKVAWVREHDGAAGVPSAELDIDEQEDATRLHLHWAALPGAEGYAVRILDENGGVIVPSLTTGAEPRVTIQDLALVPGVRYLAEVAGFSQAAGKSSFSVPTVSDGVRIVDQAPPVVEALQVSPPAFHVGAAVAIIHATARDATRLASWRLRLREAGTLLTVKEFSGPLAAPLWQTQVEWDGKLAGGAAAPPGPYEVVLDVADTAGHQTLAWASLTLCQPAQAVVAGACVTPTTVDPGVDASGSDAGGPVALPPSPEGCCDGAPRRRAARGGASWWALVLAMSITAWASLRRRT